MGARGPVPARSDQRRRRNQPETPTEQVEITGQVKIPAADESWHPKVTAWYTALEQSGQARYYEPSDWQAAQIAAETLHRFLTDEKPNAQLLAQFNAMQAALMVTEGARRRAGVEVVRRQDADPTEKPAGENVTRMDERRKRLSSSDAS